MGSVTKLSSRSAEKTATVLMAHPPVAGLPSPSIPARGSRTWFRRVRQQLRRLRRWYGIAPHARNAYRPQAPFIRDEVASPSPSNPHPHPFSGRTRDQARAL